jgi:hypothetical protein
LRDALRGALPAASVSYAQSVEGEGRRARANCIIGQEEKLGLLLMVPVDAKVSTDVPLR